MKRIDLSSVIDWLSIKITGLSVGLAMITANQAALILTFISVLSTIGYNAIRIIKELKKPKQ